MNKVIMTGNLTKDVEIIQFKEKDVLAMFSIAVNRNYKKIDGTREVDFFNVKAFNKTGENCGKFLKKGSKVTVVGSLETREHINADKKKTTVYEIIASEVEFLNNKTEE